MLTFLLIFRRMRFPRKRALCRLRPLLAAVFPSLLAALFMATVFARVARAQEAQWEGREVKEVSVVDQHGQPVSRKVPSLPLKAGNPFDFETERESLRILYATGDYSDLRVDATADDGGMRVNFVVEPSLYNNVVRVEGLKDPPSEGPALAALRLNLGEPYRENDVKEAAKRLSDLSAGEGLYEVQVRWRTEPHPETSQMDIFFTVTPGPRALIGTIQIQNQTSYSDADLLKRLKLKPKEDATSARLTRSAQALKKFLVSQGYLGAAVLISRGEYDPGSNRVPLALDVTAGPRVRVEVNGVKLSQSQIQKLLPIYAEGAVDEDLLQEGRRNIRDFLQREGYFDASVDFSSRDDLQNKERVIVYEVDRGEKSRLEGVSITGNKYFSEQLLKSRLGLEPASFAFNGRFSQQLVRDDTDSIRALYLANGFRDVEVNTKVEDNYGGKKGDLFVTFTVVEGTQTRVGSIDIEGNHALSTETLLSVIGSLKGQPYSEANVSSDRNNILAMYFNEGFPDATFQQEVKPGASAEFVDLTYRIDEGPQVLVANVLLTGYQFTRPGIIRRQVEIEAGGPLREGDVVETQRRLYNLGVFNRVQIAPQNPAGTDPEKTVVVDVTEGKRYTIGYGFGFEVQRIGANCTPAPPGGTSTCNPNETELAASPRGIFEIARSNMFGRAETLSFKVRASTLQYRSVLTYTADNFLNHKSLSLQLTGYAEKSQDVQTFTSTRYEGAFQIVETLTPASSLLYRYFYRRVTASNLNQTIDPEQIPLFSQPTLVAGFGITYAWDRRDNPADATRGMFNTIDLSDAIEALGSSASFFRAYFQNSSFHPFGHAFVFARSVRFGFEEPLGNTTSGIPTECTTGSPTPTESVIPLPERFFAGGGTSLRGFGLNQAGPRDPCTGFPIGGLALLIFNQELRFPMKLPFVGNKLGGQVLYDLGNVYSDVNHITWAWSPPSLTDLNYMSQAIGFGVRYPTPIGPVRVDFAYQLNSPLYQVTNNTTGLVQVYRVPQFQFFFNIGPVF
jgi:outer membrane protein insertion porin family